MMPADRKRDQAPIRHTTFKDFFNSTPPEESKRTYQKQVTHSKQKHFNILKNVPPM
jgi:hypothetical protein